MDSYAQEWLVLFVKWMHLIVGIAWIGASFYFNWLEGNLERGKKGLAKGVAGDLWAVHGGGFYHVEKFEVAPERLPETLHWFKWEAYFTFITGASLLLLVFYLSPSLYLVKPGLTGIPAAGILGIAVGSIIAFWLVYDWLCKTPLVNRGLWFLVVIYAILVVDAIGLSYLLSPKAAFIHVGAAIGTAMVANVFFKIIPSQKTLVQALQSGSEPDGDVGRQGFLRSLHNNYFTLPVLFIMVASHAPIAYGNHKSWIILAVIAAAGILIRHFFNLKNHGRKNYALPIAGLILLVGAVYLAKPAPAPAVAATAAQVSFQSVRQVVQDRCIVCHSAHPTFAGMNAPAAGLALDTRAEIEAHAKLIDQQAVATQTMPLGNVTHMTDKERRVLGAWIKQYLAENDK